MAEATVRGNTLTTDLVVKDDAGVLVDPLTLSLTVKTPSNTSTTYTHPNVAILHPSTGLFSSDVVLTEIGVWEYQWATTGPVRTKGDGVYVESDPISSIPSVATIVDYVRFYLGGENWTVLASSPNFGVDYIILGVETVKRRVLTPPVPSPAGESALNGNVLAYLGILTALELIPACIDAWASKIISRTTGADPAEVTTYTDRSRRVIDLGKSLLERVDDLYAAAAPYLDATLNPAAGVMEIDEQVVCHVTGDPRDFPPAWSFPYPRDSVVSSPWWIP